MMKTFVWNFFLGAVILAGLIFLFNQSRSVNLEEHNRYTSTIIRLQALDVALNENILKCRHAYLKNYDPMVQNINQLKTIAGDLASVPSFIEDEVRARLAPAIENYLDLMREKEILIERFKSENAILHNALGFFPVAATELIRNAMSANPPIAAELQDLLERVLIYNLYPDDGAIPQIKSNISILLKKQGDSSRFIDRNKLERVIQHANAILKFKRQLDRVTGQALEIPAQQSLHAIHSEYYGGYVKKMDMANTYRMILCLLAILLSTAIAYIILRLRHATIALNQANETLEQNVADRTEDLHRANLALIEQKDQLTRYLDELRAAQEELQRVAVTDELTGLYTRRFLFEWLEKQMKNILRNTGLFSCLLVDIDFFKSINDNFGHTEGDRVLKHVAQVMRNCVRGSDIVGRYGGEEFLILLPDTFQDNALTLAEKMRSAIEATVVEPKKITVSIGVGCCRCQNSVRDDLNTSELIVSMLDIADRALYWAKAQGRNQVVPGGKILTIKGQRIPSPQTTRLYRIK